MEDSKVISDLKKDGESLIKTQEIIMNNFKKISPELDKVESLVASMNDTAATLNDPKIKEKLAASMLKP
jgi:peptidoglycan hydrolase CwlO-like protein